MGGKYSGNFIIVRSIGLTESNLNLSYSDIQLQFCSPGLRKSSSLEKNHRLFISLVILLRISQIEGHHHRKSHQSIPAESPLVNIYLSVNKHK